MGSRLDIARVDYDPIATAAIGAAEWNLSGKPGPQEFKEMLAMRTESRFGAAVITGARPRGVQFVFVFEFVGLVLHGCGQYRISSTDSFLLQLQGTTPC
jgi:hypothetical protein